MSNKVFPNIRDEEEPRIPPKKNELSISIFGNRFLVDQNLYEYLIEFLLIFVSPKTSDFTNGKFKFHDFGDKEFCYYVYPRIGLKRFIFYYFSKKDKSIPEDKEAYNLLRNLLCNKLKDVDSQEEKEQIVDAIRDFLYGYAVILKKRNWSAQAILPLCPELIFCEASPNQKKRQKTVDWKNNRATIDTEFEFNQRNFLARGGELYYLHILQGLEKSDDKSKINKLEGLLKNLLTKDTEKISNIANFIQNTWEEEILVEGDKKSKEIKGISKKIDYIPINAYASCSQYSIDELINYLSAELPIVKRIDLLSKGMMYQIMRMLCSAVSSRLNITPIPWVIDFIGVQSFRRFAHKTYSQLEESFESVLNLVIDEKQMDMKSVDKYNKIKSEKNRFGFGILKSKGKELHCIIPIKGGDERFSLSEDIISFLVLALVPPSEQITFDMFLDRLNKHFNIIIGPKQFKESKLYTEELGNSLSKYFERNVLQFEQLLNNTGFLIDLSDATSVVANPYKHI